MAYIPLSIWLQRMEQHWGWLADGIIWQFWMPVEWFRLFGELLLAWGIVLILAFAFSLAKKEYIKYLKIATSRTSCGIIMTT